MSITSPLEALLNKFCRPLNAPDYPGGTEKTNAGNSLDFLVKTVPQFTELIRGNDVLDYRIGTNGVWHCDAQPCGYLFAEHGDRRQSLVGTRAADLRDDVAVTGPEGTRCD